MQNIWVTKHWSLPHRNKWAHMLPQKGNCTCPTVDEFQLRSSSFNHSICKSKSLPFYTQICRSFFPFRPFQPLLPIYLLFSSRLPTLDRCTFQNSLDCRSLHKSILLKTVVSDARKLTNAGGTILMLSERDWLPSLVPPFYAALAYLGYCGILSETV